MPGISIISSSIRDERKSHRVALYLRKYLEANKSVAADILDLKEYNFPLFTERLSYQKSPAEKVTGFAEKIRTSDGIIVVTPEYNGGYPASLKNIVDLLYEEWYHKPVAIASVSDGNFAGTQVLTSLQFSLWKMRAWTVPAMFRVPNVGETFDEEGNPSGTSLDRAAASFIRELFWCIEANRRMATI